MSTANTAAISAALIKELREETGAGMMDCKKALEASGGDKEKAKSWLRDRGVALAAKKEGRTAEKGMVGSYIHHNATVGVLLELNCETDFVARTDDFQKLHQELCFQIAAMKPRWVSRDQVDAATLDLKRKEFEAEAVAQKKPEAIAAKIAEGKLDSWLADFCLLDQTYAREPSGKVKIKDLLTEAVAKMGENILVRRFVRYEVGKDEAYPGPFAMSPRAYKRVLLKISGEAFKGTERYGIDVESVHSIAKEISTGLKPKLELAIVVGGGNIWRGTSDRARGIDRVTADYMGMMATLINALALQDALEKMNVPTRVQSAIEVAKLAEGYIRRRAVRHLEKGRVVIFAGGIGNPYFSTDTTAALRAVEIGADVLLKGTQVDGVYSADPRTNPKAKKLKELTAMQAIRRQLGVMDTTAFSLCRENKLPIVVFNLYKAGNVRRAMAGESVGTFIRSH